MEIPDASWERFRADIRGCKVVDHKKRRPRVHFHIPIRLRTAKYRPGEAPSPPPVNLQLVHDSDAFIVDKVVLPRVLSQPRNSYQRRCYYIIGWPDLPAARPAVDASKILDYVSPRSLEDWEYQDALRREEEREQQREHERLERERAGAQGMAVAAPSGSFVSGAKRTPGRPRRPTMAVAEATPEPELDIEQKEIIHKRMRGPSLSTPQKSKLAQLVAEEEMLEELDRTGEDAESAIQRQLLAEGEGASDGHTDVGDPEMPRLSSAASKRPSRESSRASSIRLGLSTQSSSPARAMTGLATHGTPVPVPLLSTLSRRATDSGPKPSSNSSQVLARPLISTTPIPLPSYCRPPVNKWVSKPGPEGRPSTDLRPRVGTPQEQVPASTPLLSDHVHGQSSSLSHSPTHTGGFTPIGGAFTRPSKRPADDSPVPASVAAKRKPKKSKKHAEMQTEPAAPANPAADLLMQAKEYVVKRLEDDRILDGVHWFQVRWEGDWPDADNPTWEPRENISEALVKQYLKRKAKRKADRTDSRMNSAMNQANPFADWAKRYSSVAEAFEGQAELNATNQAMLGAGNTGNGDAGTDDGPEELLVIDKNETAGIESRKPTQAQVAAQFARMGSAAPVYF